MITFFTGPRKCFRASEPLVKSPSGLDYDLRSHGGPVELGRFLDLEDAEAFSFHGDGIFGIGHPMGKVAQNRIVLEQVRKGVRGGECRSQATNSMAGSPSEARKMLRPMGQTR